MDYSLGLYEKAMPSGLSFEEMLSVTAKCGFDRLEISVDETEERLARLDWSPDRQYELGRLSRRAGVPIRTMCLSGHRKYPFGTRDPEKEARSMEIMEKAVDFCVNAGISIIQLAGYDVYYEEGGEDTRARFEKNLRSAVDYAAGKGVFLAFETMETPFMDTVEKAMHYVNRIDSPWLGVYPDIGNMKNAAVLYGHDVVDDLKKGAGHICAMHLKETLPGVYRDMEFGSGGHTEYERCISAAYATGVRLFTGEFWYKKGSDYIGAITAAGRFLRSKIESCM